jgi:hypothetical protein
MYKNNSVMIKWNDNTSGYQGINQGVWQEWPLSPMFLNIHMNIMIIHWNEIAQMELK